MRGAALGAAVVLLCAACSGEPPAARPAGTAPSSAAPAAPAVPAVPGVEAEVVRLRTDVVVGGQVQVRVSDTGDEPFTVTAVAIDSPGFVPEPATAVTAEFRPGRVIDLPTPYGAPVCTGGPSPAAARLSVTRPGGAVEEVRVPLTGDDLEVVHEEECALAGVRAVVDVVLTGMTAGDEEVTGTLVLRRRGDDDRAVSAVDVRDSVVFDVAVDGLPLGLGADDDEARAGVTLTSATCEPHVLAETKQPFVFPLQVVVDDADPVPVRLPVDAAQQDLLWQLVDRVCAPAG
ncbi:hypothetical protein [Geodermatophilus sp. CPCC 206100]|uniref:hypothetical protein n=1 Tax=Geodermatophilus sp. CPCC 206100 TaxID=3020054 RepID=UPI003AFFEAAE